MCVPLKLCHTFIHNFASHPWGIWVTRHLQSPDETLTWAQIINWMASRTWGEAWPFFFGSIHFYQFWLHGRCCPACLVTRWNRAVILESAGHLLRKSRSAAMSQDCSETAPNLKVLQCVCLRACVYVVWEEHTSQLTGVLTWWTQWSNLFAKNVYSERAEDFAKEVGRLYGFVFGRQWPFAQQRVSQSVRVEPNHSTDLLHILTSSQQVRSKLKLVKLFEFMREETKTLNVSNRILPRHWKVVYVYAHICRSSTLFWMSCMKSCCFTRYGAVTGCINRWISQCASQTDTIPCRVERRPVAPSPHSAC